MKERPPDSDASAITSNESSPNKGITLDAMSLNFPAYFTARNFETINKITVRLSSNASVEMLDEFIELNPDKKRNFFLIGRDLFFDNLSNTNIHESAVERFREYFANHARSIAQKHVKSEPQLWWGDFGWRRNPGFQFCFVSTKEVHKRP